MMYAITVNESRGYFRNRTGRAATQITTSAKVDINIIACVVAAMALALGTSGSHASHDRRQGGTAR